MNRTVIMAAMTNTKPRKMIDPPQGWRYGFPCEFEPWFGETVEQYIIRMGYPSRDAKWAANYCRFWYEEQE